MGINYKKKYLKYKKKYLEFKKLRGGMEQGEGSGCIERAVSKESTETPEHQAQLNLNVTKKDLEYTVSELKKIIKQPSGLNFTEKRFFESNPSGEYVANTINNIKDFSKKINYLLETLETYLSEIEDKEKKDNAKMDKVKKGDEQRVDEQRVDDRKTEERIAAVRRPLEIRERERDRERDRFD